MSGWSSIEDCPMCGADQSLETWGDNRPTDSVGGMCLECGYFYETVEKQMSLEEVNEERKDVCLPPLESLRPKLPEHKSEDTKDPGIRKIGRCNKCGRIYDDEASVTIIEAMVENGYAPCPVMDCTGHFEIVEERIL